MFLMVFFIVGCTGKAYIVKEGELIPVRSGDDRSLASEKYSIEHDSVTYYFDSLEEAEKFQVKIKKSKILSPQADNSRI